MSTTGEIDTASPIPAKRDLGLYAILAANVLTLAIALWQDWSMIDLVFPFWMQSVVIGIFARRRILKLQQFTTDDLLVNGQRVDATPKTRRMIGNFFALHYGLFHLAYLVFLGALVIPDAGDAAIADPAAIDPRIVYAAIALSFLISHGASHREHLAADLAGKPNIGTLMFVPYIRIVPMHLMIIFGSLAADASGIVLFTVLKTFADLGMHRIEHRMLAGKLDKSADSTLTRQGHDAIYGRSQTAALPHGRRRGRKRR